MYIIAIFAKKKNTTELSNTINVTMIVQAIQKLKNKDYGQKQDEDEC